MKALEEDLISKFGADAYYTYISYLRLNDDNAYGVNVQVSDDKESAQQDIWLYEAGTWTNTGPMIMQISAQTPGFYKFQLKKEVHLEQLGRLIEQSMDSFKVKYPDTEPILSNAVLNTNNTVTDAQTKFRYTVILKDKKNNEVMHSYTYGIDGQLLNAN